MRVDCSHPEYDKYIVYLNGWIQKAAIAADNEEGWVEVVDIRAMAQLDLETECETETSESSGSIDFSMAEPIPVATKKLYGTVEIIKVPEK